MRVSMASMSRVSESPAGEIFDNACASVAIWGRSSSSMRRCKVFRLSKLRLRLRYQGRLSSADQGVPSVGPSWVVVTGRLWSRKRASPLMVHSTSWGRPKVFSRVMAMSKTRSKDSSSSGGRFCSACASGIEATPPSTGRMACSRMAGVWLMTWPDCLSRVHRSGAMVPSTRPWLRP